jgi:hypothetical protein
MTRIRRLAELICLGVLATSASAKALSDSSKTSPDQVARNPAPDPGAPEYLDQKVHAHRTPVTTETVDEARRDAASMSSIEFSGGPTGTLLAGAALLTAVAIVLAVLVPW